jgi:hypothetical protein
MTVRESILRQKRKAGVVALAGFLLFVLGMVIRLGGPPLLALALPGFALCAGSIVYLLVFVRCPICRGAIGPAVSYGGRPFSIGSSFQYCPFCGIAFNSEVPDNKA